MTLEQSLSQTLERLLLRVIDKHKDKLELRVVETFDDYHRHDKHSAAKRLNVKTPEFARKLPLKWFQDPIGHKDWYVLERDIKAYLDNRIAVASDERDVKRGHVSTDAIDDEVAALLNLPTSAQSASKDARKRRA